MFRRSPQWPSDAFASYYHDGISEEYFYFKLMTQQSISRIVRALKSMRILDSYRLDLHEEEFRNGVVPRKWRILVLRRDELLMPLQDIKRVISELATAENYTLHWIPPHRLLNLAV